MRYDPIWLDEYKMMRDELVNYMEKLQTVRNMMYIVIGSILTCAFTAQIHFLCTLLPLFFILPLFAIVSDYWVCVRKASAYLVVFHESYEDCPIHWESRHNMLKKSTKENFKKSVKSNIGPQLGQYYSCVLMIMFIYAFQLWKRVLDANGSIEFYKVEIDGLTADIYIYIGVIALFVSLFLLNWLSRGPSYDDFLKRFIMIKNSEEQTMIGKSWSNGICVEDKIINQQDVTEFIKIFL